MTEIKWQIKPSVSAAGVAKLARELSQEQAFPGEIAALLVQRGVYDFATARRYFKPGRDELHDSQQMLDMDKAVARLLQAIEAAEPIMLLGDYDVDGTSAVSLMSLFFQAWGIDHSYYIPDRYTEGYGVSYRGIDQAEARGARLIISLDCGIKAADKVRYAALKDIDFIVCDHHQPGAELPAAVAILDPKRKDCPYPYKELTGCGVGLKLAQALATAFTARGMQPRQPEGLDPFAAFCDLATLSIACDIVPITGENRIIAHFGLKKLRENPLPGLQAIMDQAKETREWNVSDLVFFVGPRVNSAGRIGHAEDAVKVLLGDSPHLIRQAEELQSSNEARKALDREMTQEALALLAGDPHYPQRHTTVLYQPAWHKGVIGIVASRLIEHHYRPTVLLARSEDMLVGSARSVEGFDLYSALEACAEHIVQFGGHTYAAGLRLREEDYPAFRDRFEAEVARRIKPEQRFPVLEIDQRLRFKAINARFIRLIERMAPFGPFNLRPVFMSEGVEVLHTTLLKEDHVKFVLSQDGLMIEAIGFNLAQKWQQLREGPLHIAYHPMFNHWNGKTRINLILKDVKHAEDPIA